MGTSGNLVLCTPSVLKLCSHQAATMPQRWRCDQQHITPLIPLSFFFSFLRRKCNFTKTGRLLTILYILISRLKDTKIVIKDLSIYIQEVNFVCFSNHCAALSFPWRPPCWHQTHSAPLDWMPMLPIRPGAPSPSTAPPVARPGACHSPTWMAAGCLTWGTRTGQRATLHAHLWPSRGWGMEDSAPQQCQAWPPAPGPPGPPPGGH